MKRQPPHAESGVASRTHGGWNIFEQVRVEWRVRDCLEAGVVQSAAQLGERVRIRREGVQIRQ